MSTRTRATRLPVLGLIRSGKFGQLGEINETLSNFKRSNVNHRSSRTFAEPVAAVEAGGGLGLDVFDGHGVGEPFRMAPVMPADVTVGVDLDLYDLSQILVRSDLEAIGGP